MRLREHKAVKSKSDQFQVDPRLLKVVPGFNIRDLDVPEERPELDELKDMIRGRGVRRPLVVRMIGDDVVIVDGHRRHKVVLELIDEGEPIETVPAIQEAPGTNDEERILNLKLMNSGKPLTRQQDAEIVRRLKGYGWSDDKIAQGMGWKSKNSVKQALDIAEFSDRLNKHIAAGHISATEARKAVKSVGDDKTCEIIEANLSQPTGKASARQRVTPKVMQQANPKKPTTKERAVAEQRQKALDALPVERRRLVRDHGYVNIDGNSIPFEYVTEADWAQLLGTPEPQKPDPDQAAAFSNGHAGTSEYTPPGEAPAAPAPLAPEPLPTDAAPSPASEGPQPEATPPVATSDSQVAPAAEPSSPKPITHLTNGTFFKAAEPIADALVEQVDFSQFGPGDHIGFQISFDLAAAFVAAVNQARGS